MSRRLLTALLFVVSLTAVNGCGLLPTDRPPTNGGYSVHYFPDVQQPKWQRLLFGTNWIGEGPAQ